MVSGAAADLGEWRRVETRQDNTRRIGRLSYARLALLAGFHPTLLKVMDRLRLSRSPDCMWLASQIGRSKTFLYVSCAKRFRAQVTRNDLQETFLLKPPAKDQQLAMYANLNQLAESLRSDLGMQPEAKFEEFLDNSVQLLETEMHAIGIPKDEAIRLISEFRMVARSAWNKSSDKRS